MKSWSEYLADETDKKETRVSRERERQLKEHKKHTNADRIRAMSDEELAEILFGSCFEEMGKEGCEGGYCKLCILEWLKSEVKE